MAEQKENEDSDEDDHRRGKEKEAARHGHVRYRRKERRRSREDEAGEIEKQYLDEYSDDDEEDDLIRIGERGWRDRYLLQKFGVPSSDKEFYQRYPHPFFLVSCLFSPLASVAAW